MANKHTTLEQLRKLATKTKEEIASLDAKIKSGAHAYTVQKAGTAEAGFLATYQLTEDGVPVGEKINIPKDFLVKSATIETVSVAGTPYKDAKAGDKYIDFVVNTKDGDGEASHVYLAVNDLVDTYTPGTGITISEENSVSLKMDVNNAHGLSVTDAGLRMGLASGEADGAMSIADKTKLDNIETATNQEVEAMITEVFDSEG